MCPYERPERWDYIDKELQDRGLKDYRSAKPLDMRLVGRVHSADYIEFLGSAWAEWKHAGNRGEAIPTGMPIRRMRQRVPRDINGKLGYYCMAVETAITEGSWAAACSSAACAVSAQKLVAPGKPAFALCRPPGHHAGLDYYGGYCFLNNASIAAQGFLEEGARRVALLDVDFHHGNGSQDIFYERDDVLFLSLHGQPQDAFPYYMGYADESGTGKGEGFNRNYPLPPGTDYAGWSDALHNAGQKITEYAPDALVVSLGVDTFEKDPISFFRLKGDDYLDMGARIAALGLPTLFVMEGGYAVEEIGVNTVNVLEGFSDG